MLIRETIHPVRWTLDIGSPRRVIPAMRPSRLVAVPLRFSARRTSSFQALDPGYPGLDPGDLRRGRPRRRSQRMASFGVQQGLEPVRTIEQEQGGEYDERHVRFAGGAVDGGRPQA